MDDKLLGFHVARDARDNYQLDEDFFAYRGKALIPSFQIARRFSNKINQKRDIANFPHETLPASQVNAVALIHGITHHLFRLYCETRPALVKDALERAQEDLGGAATKTLDKFLSEFPPQPIYHREEEAEEYLTHQQEGRTNYEVTLEELLMLWLANSNPAFSSMSEFMDDAVLEKQTAYNKLTQGLNTFFTEIAKGDPGDARFPSGMNIIDILLEPARQSPHSLDGQLKFLADRWNSVLGAYVYRILTMIDILKEDFRPIPGPPGPGTAQVPYYDRSMYDLESENFTQDREWMPNLVLIAKNAYVWLDQLSKKYGRQITTLDQVPDEELDQLAAWGITGLWLIGLWERSQASQRIKVMCGNADAVASAYSLLKYEIAGRLGGEAACNVLHERAWRRGIRLASDMVPNHMGIDADWVMDHPDWFLSLDYSPYPNYTFNGANLSSNPGVGIYLEDHYYDRTDAAVVFKRVNFYTGQSHYIYHGNDGTSMPWNDTAQLNYLHPEVREAMIQVILNIAKQFPIIRFDAAMTLVKKHIQRLWFPEPGTGGAIPSRAEHGIPRPDFEKLMPEEFWREVIDRAAIEAPDTLLLAEAFWLLESYFVRTLGMHRVYNSAYMNMMRDEENAKYRTLIKNTLEFDLEILRRYVNFLNNPDEKTAVEQFGKGDKYFGVTTVMLTMPGLPMLGHGQVEGFAEKYGMEYYRAYWDEQPDTYLIQRHEREIFPLVKKRYLFAGVENFLMYDFYAPHGTVDENVFAYSNSVGDERAVVLYNNVYGSTRGTIRLSAAFSIKTGGDNRELVQRTLGEGLHIQANENQFCIFRDHPAGLEYIRSSRELAENGLYVELNGYQAMVLIDWRIVEDTATQQYHQLAAHLGGRGVPSIDDALRELMMEPVRAPFWALVNGDMFRRLLETRETPDEDLMEAIETKYAALLDAVAEFTETTPVEEAPPIAEKLEALLQLPSADLPDDLALLMRYSKQDTALWSGLMSWLIVRGMGDAADVRSWLDEWLLNRVIAGAVRDLGVQDDYRVAQTVSSVKLATSLPELFSETYTPDTLLDTLLQEPDGQNLLNLNSFQEIVWFNREGFEHLLRWLILTAQLDGTDVKQRYAAVSELLKAAEKSGYQMEKLRQGVRKTPAAVNTRLNKDKDGK